MKFTRKKLFRFQVIPIFLILVSLITGCAPSHDWLSSSGPSYDQVQRAPAVQNSSIQIVDVNDVVAQKLLAAQKQNLFSEVFNQSMPPASVIGAGDVLEVSIWEAPPALLFSSGTASAGAGTIGTHVTVFPEQMVDSNGTINVPFAGQILAKDCSPHEIEAKIANRLKGKANQPQVLVRRTRNNTSNVTVVGEVTSSLRMPLTAKGERLLDALAAAGGVRQPVSKVTLQLTRGDRSQALPLETIIRDPKQNIFLQPGDVITSVLQPLSFTILGATSKNDEINFETQGISLAQALARAGGLQDARADAQGVFIFRFESPNVLKQDSKVPLAMTPDGRVPVIYRIDLKDPATFFVAQSFPVQNKDVLYVSNAPAAELQKFLNIVLSIGYPILSVTNAVK